MTVRGCSSPSCGIVHGGPINTLVKLGPIGTTAPRAANAVGLTALREVSPDLWARSTEESRAITEFERPRSDLIFTAVRVRS